MFRGGGGGIGDGGTGAGGSSGGGRENNEALARMAHMMIPMPPAPVMVVGGGAESEEFPRRDERVPQWSQQETRDFIGIRAELERDFTVAKRNKTLWEVVAGRMKEIGYRRTPDQCKCKWKNLVNRYKGKETSDPDNGRSFPFFEEMHALFTERATNTPQIPIEPETASGQSKKRVNRVDSYQSFEEISEDEDEDEYENDENRTTKGTNTPKRKAEKEKRPRTSNFEKPPTPRQLNTGKSSSHTIQEILQDFFRQQQMIDMQWRELLEKRAYERQLFEQEWRQSMERLERERMTIEQSWREKEEQRRMREESRAERRDALLTALLNKLIHEQ